MFCVVYYRMNNTVFFYAVNESDSEPDEVSHFLLPVSILMARNFEFETKSRYCSRPLGSWILSFLFKPFYIFTSNPKCCKPFAIDDVIAGDKMLSGGRTGPTLMLVSKTIAVFIVSTQLPIISYQLSCSFLMRYL